MKQFKHYSFDVWNTLIRRNEEYREKREEYFHFYFLKRGVKLEKGRLDEVMVEVWDYFDQHSKLFGKAPNPLEMYAMLIFRVTGKLTGISVLEMQSLYADLERLFLKYPPSLYDNNTRFVLEELDKRGKTLSILSNTSFIKGSTIKQALEILDIDKHFKFMLFSDVLGFSKPHEVCFQEVASNVASIHGIIPSDDIIHIGDKELEDGQGAYEAGFAYLVINSNSYTIKDLL